MRAASAETIQPTGPHSTFNSGAYPSYMSTGRPESSMDGQEVVRRQAEWEREIETLDQKEMELHQSQLRLIREQTAIFIRDLATLQQEVATLKPILGQHASMADRMEYLERVLGDSADRHSHELHDAHGKLDQLHGRLSEQHSAGQEGEARHLSLARRVDMLEQSLSDATARHSRELQEAKTSHTRLDNSWSKVHEERQSTVADRMAYIEKVVGDSFDKHDKALKAAHSKLDQMHGTFGQQHGFLKDGHDTIQSRLDQLEQLVRDSVDRHSREIEASKASHTKLSNDAKVRETHGTTLQQRLEFLEKAVGDSVEKHAKEIDFSRNKLDQLHSRLGEHHAQLVHHATLAERISYVEKLVGDSAEKHTEEVAVAHAKVDQMRSRLATVESHGSSIDSLKKSHASLQAEKAKHDAHYSSQGERLDYLENVVGELAEKFGREGTDSKNRLEQMHTRVLGCEKHGSSITDLQKAHASSNNEKATSDAHHATTRERLDYLEGLLGSNADKHFKEIEALKTSHTKLSTESKQRDGHHSTMSERLNFLEQLLGDSADKHAQELAVAHAKLDQMHGRLSSCEAHGVAIDGLKKSHASLAGEKSSFGTLHSSLSERLEHLERLLNESSATQGRELAKAHAKLDQLHGRVSANERGVGAIGDVQKAHSVFASEKAQLLEQQKQVHAKLDDLHRTVADHNDRHTREMDSVKAMHGRMASDVKARDSQHAASGSKIEQMETALAGVADRHKRELADAHSKISALQGRASEDKGRHEEHVRSLLANEKETRDLHHATLKERVDYLEGVLGESKTKHDQELEVLKKAHAAHSKEAKASSSRHATVDERLQRLEKLLKDGLEGHAQHISAAHAKLEQVHSRVAACEQHGARLSQLHSSHAGQATDKAAHSEKNFAQLTVKVEYLESLIGESAEKHQKNTKEVVQVAHSKLISEGQHRDLKHATLEERLKYVEKTLGDSFEEHTQALTAAHSKLQDMHARVALCEAHSTAIETLKKSHSSLQGDHAAREVHHGNVGERLSYLEKLFGETADRHGKEVAGAHAKADQLHHRLMDEKAAREAQMASIDLSKDQHRSAGFGDHNFQNRLDALEGKVAPLPAKCNELQQAVKRITQMQEQKDQHLAEHLANEKQARTGHEQDVMSRLAHEKSARDAHEYRVGDQFGKEKFARDQHAKLVQDELRRHAAAHEESKKEVHDIITKDKSTREQNTVAHSENLYREKASRGGIEDLVAQEKAERTRHHETINERVDSLQKSVNIFDKLIRTEMDERSKENKRIWDAIDNHTHDLSTQVVADGGYDVNPHPVSVNMAQQPPPALSMLATAVAPASVPAAHWPGQPMTTALVHEPMVRNSGRGYSPAPTLRNASPASFGLGIAGGSPALASPVLVQTSGVGGIRVAGLGLFAASPTLVSRPPSPPRYGAPPWGDGQLAAAIGHDHYHHMDLISCGHTRYGTERHRPAEIMLE